MSKIQSYIDAGNKYDAAQERARQYRDVVLAVAELLKSRPDQFRFTNIPAPRSNPGAQVSEIDGGSWPSAVQIQESISAWISAFEAMQTAWRGVPDNEKGQLRPPPSSPNL